MGNSGSFDTGTGELAPRTGEFLAGVLALSRISRVTVALESGHGAGPALLAAARLTAHAETCLLFDHWRGNPLADLSAALFSTHPDIVPGPDTDLAQGLRKLQSHARHSFLIIFDRFDEYLAQPAGQPHSADFERAFVRLANDSELDVHFLLVQDEAAEPLLSRFQDAIPGIGDGCLRMPAGATAGGADASPAAQGGRASRRDRSFGMLLERLTAIAPADEAADRQPDANPAMEAPESQARHPLPGILRDHEVAPAFDDTAGTELRPVFDDRPANEVRPVFEDIPANEARGAGPERATVASGPAIPPAQAASTDASATMPAPPVPTDLLARGNVLPPAPARRGRALAALMAAVLAVGAGVYAYRQQPSAATTGKPAASAQAGEPAAAAAVAAAPSGAKAESPPATPAPALMAAPALAAETSAPQAPAATPATPAAPATPVAPALPAGPDATGAAPARTAPTVYVHVRSPRERERLQSLAHTLAKQGIRVVDVKVMSIGPSVADLRYFRDEDRDTALAVQKAMVSAGVPVPKLSRMNGYENSTRPGHFEAWLGSGKAPEPVRRR